MRNLFMLFLVSLLVSCGDSSRKEEALNDPEIVSRDSDTVFNQVPGENHLGIDAYTEDAENLIRTVSKDPSLTKFNILINQARMGEDISGDKVYTIFAPSNAAFESLESSPTNPFGTNDEQMVRKLVQNHLVEGTIYLDSLEGHRSFKTLSGESVSIHALDDGQFRLNKATVKPKGHQASNGMVYIIDQVNIPSAQ